MQSANITNHRLLLTALLIGSAMNRLTQLGEAQYIALETYKKNGQAVPTPVWVTQEAGKLYVITEGNSGKVKRIRNNSQISSVNVISTNYGSKLRTTNVCEISPWWIGLSFVVHC